MPAEAGRRRSPLPRTVPLLALVALAITGVYLVPAVAEHRRLERESSKRERMAREAQAALEQRRARLEQSASISETYARRKKRQALLNQGPAYLQERSAKLRALDAARKRARARRAAAAEGTDR